MCFKNLPIGFDSAGKAQLRAGVNDPYSVATADPYPGSAATAARRRCLGGVSTVDWKSGVR